MTWGDADATAPAAGPTFSRTLPPHVPVHRSTGFLFALIALTLTLIAMTWVLLLRRRRSNTLRETEDRVRLLVDEASDAIFILDLHGVISMTNPRCETVLRYSTDEIVGSRFSAFLTAEDREHRPLPLDRLPVGRIDDELDRSIGLIADRTGVEAEHFAYPKALPGSDVADRAVRARFRSAAVGGMRANAYGATDPHALNRSPIQVSDRMRWFRRKATGGMWLEDVIRGRVNRRRYADATT